VCLQDNSCKIARIGNFYQFAEAGNALPLPLSPPPPLPRPSFLTHTRVCKKYFVMSNVCEFPRKLFYHSFKLCKLFGTQKEFLKNVKLLKLTTHLFFSGHGLHSYTSWHQPAYRRTCVCWTGRNEDNFGGHKNAFDSARRGGGRRPDCKEKEMNMLS
jgi:hypothetical protein